MRLVDSHVHLDRYREDDVGALIERATSRGVVRLLTVGMDVRSSERGGQIANANRHVDAAVGLHPRRVRGEVTSKLISRFAVVLGNRFVRAVGEIGLDARATTSMTVQRDWFDQQLGWAEARRLPTVLHVVDAHSAALELLRQHDVAGVLHYFCGTPAQAESYLSLGLHISVGKPILRPDPALIAAIRMIPIERLMLETDSFPQAGRRTEPGDVEDVCHAVAAIKNLSAVEVADRTTANYEGLIGVPM